MSFLMREHLGNEYTNNKSVLKHLGNECTNDKSILKRLGNE